MTQHELVPPPGYVQALPVPTHGDSIADGTACFEIPNSIYPVINRALNLIRADSGGPTWPAQASSLVAERWRPYIDRIEAALAPLRDNAPAPEDDESCEAAKTEGCSLYLSELYNFVLGEHFTSIAIAKRSPELALASLFMNDFFEGWSLCADEVDLAAAALKGEPEGFCPAAANKEASL